jgi:hypothetical protein
MTESEVLFPTRCPICRQEVLTAFRISVVADALANRDLRLYSTCHVASWDASQSELERIRQFLDASWDIELQEAFEDLSLDQLSGADDGFAFPPQIEEIDYDEAMGEQAR